MHSHLYKLSLCALTALAAAWAPVHAATSTATASIEQFRYELVDLDLSDGVTPSITFTQEYWKVDTFGAGQRQSSAAPATNAIVSEFGSAGGTASDTVVSSTASVNHPLPLDGVYHAYRNDSYHVVEFTLSPNTQMIFTGLGTVLHDRQGYFDSSSSHIGMEGSLWGGAGGLIDEFRKTYGTGNGSATINLYATLMTGAHAGEGRFALQTWAILSGPVTTVPEPSTYGMLLAGTFLVGAVARRQRRAAARQAA